jgi:predicted nucleotidyltransferase component of viral defense system
MEAEKFPINNPRQLKDRINNMAKKRKLVANTVLQNYMMERLLERVSVSEYRDNFILKGGFLIAAMVGLDMRSTMDMDTTIKGLPVSQDEIAKIISEILAVPVNDNVTFEIMSIKPIHEAGRYKDFRLGILATFFTIRVNLKLDITTGDVVIPREVDYSFKLMFEDRSIQVKAYNLNTILAEKIESILARNVANTRARDYYDVYILLTTRSEDMDKTGLLAAIDRKAKERNTAVYIEQHEKYLADIRRSHDLLTLWNAYKSKYPYAEDIEFETIVDCLAGVFARGVAPLEKMG